MSEENKDVSRETSAPKRDKRTSVYLYLVVLFGAAFLMLLLAYFVQQRNNASVLDDLRSSSNATREELLEANQRLEEENAALKAEKDQISEELARDQADLEQLSEDHQAMIDQMNLRKMRDIAENALDYLEQFNDTGDWLMSAVIVECCDKWYNGQNPEFEDYGLLPSQTARYLALREQVLKRSGHLTLEPAADGGDSGERPQFIAETVDTDDYDTAIWLLKIFICYPSFRTISATYLAQYANPDKANNLANLNIAAFHSHTVELIAQVRDDLLASGDLVMDGGYLKTAGSN